MNKNLLPACMIAIILFTACVGGAPKDESVPLNNPTVMPAKPANNNNNKSVFNDVKVGSTSSPQILPAQPQPLNAAATTAGLNPEHGKPNHRCDIAVGAPLNSPPKQLQQSVPATQSMPAATLQPAPQPIKVASTAAGLNPAHGQPNHRCDIAVGAPLNSPANKSIQQTMPATQPPPIAPPPAAGSNGSVRLNPAHGQPGHDCTIAVGQPLKS